MKFFVVFFLTLFVVSFSSLEYANAFETHGGPGAVYPWLSAIKIGDHLGLPVHQEITKEGLSFLNDPTKTLLADQHIYMEGDQSSANHFDNCAFSESIAKINYKYRIAVGYLNPKFPQPDKSAEEFGRLLHTVQDFYAHTNWVEMKRTTLVDQGYSYWTDIPYFSLSTGDNQVFSFEVQKDSKTNELVYSKFANKVIRVKLGDDNYKDIGLISGTYGESGDNKCLPGASVPHGSSVGPYFSFADNEKLNKPDALNKDHPKQKGHATARYLAVKQTEHEFCRLVELTRTQWGSDGVDVIYKNWVKNTNIAISKCPLIEKSSTIITDTNTSIGSVQEFLIPNWIKQNAKWWSDGITSDKEFANSVGFLVKEKIITVNVPTADDGTLLVNDNLQIPDWIKQNAKWWADGKIQDGDFTSGIEYMIKENVITFSEKKIISIEPDFTISISPDSFTLPSGGYGEVDITVKSLNGWNERIWLNIPIPIGPIKYPTIVPKLVTPTPTSDATAAFAVDVSEFSCPGDYRMAVYGMRQDKIPMITHYEYFNLTILPPGKIFELNSDQQVLTIPKGGSKSFDLKIKNLDKHDWGFLVDPEDNFRSPSGVKIEHTQAAILVKNGESNKVTVNIKTSEDIRTPMTFTLPMQALTALNCDPALMEKTNIVVNIVDQSDISNQVEIIALNIDGAYYPLAQFGEKNASWLCDSTFWSPTNDDYGTNQKIHSIDGFSIAHKYDNCGHGKINETKPMLVKVPKEQADDYMNKWFISPYPKDTDYQKYGLTKGTATAESSDATSNTGNSQTGGTTTGESQTSTSPQNPQTTITSGPPVKWIVAEIINGEYYPWAQFKIGYPGDSCNDRHVFSIYPNVRSLNGVYLTNPDPNHVGCGFGAASTFNEVEDYPITQAQIDSFKADMGFEP